MSQPDNKLQLLEFGEFILFCYLCMARADHKLTLEETDELFSRIDIEHFSGNTPHEPLISKVYKIHHKLSEDDRLKLIAQNAHKWLKSDSDKEKIIADLGAIMLSDGRAEAAESNLLKKITKAIYSGNK